MATQLINLSSKIVIRNDTSEIWHLKNPVLLKGECGYSTDAGVLKIGDGQTTWNDLINFKPDTTVLDETDPTTADADVHTHGTVWLNSTTAQIYILTYEVGKGKNWQKFITADNLDLCGIMKSVDFAKTVGAGKNTGYVDKSLIADKLTNVRSLALSGDVTGSALFDGSANTTIAATLNSSGVTANTYTKVTVNAKGIVTKGEALVANDIPTIPNTKVSGLGSAATLNTGTAAGQIPLLVAGGKLPDAVMPNLAIGNVFEAATEAAMLALTAAQSGDVCIRSDVNKTFILSTNTPNVAASWKELKTPTCEVISVNGQKGAVTLTTANIAESTNMFYTQARFDAALTAKSTTNLKEGTNQYFTNARVQAFIEDPDNIFVLNGGNALGN